MGKKLIIKGANFYTNRIDTEFNPTTWFVDAIDSIAMNIPQGYAVGTTTGIQSPYQDTGMRHPNSSTGMLVYGDVINSDGWRWCTPNMVSLKTLSDNGITAIKLTPKQSGTCMVAYSDTPSTSSTNPFNPGNWSYNTDLTTKTIPITSATYIVVMAKSSDASEDLREYSITHWFDISFD